MTAIPVTHKLREPKQQPVAMIGLLNQLLANTLHFRLSAKQAHWNVRGSNFIALHDLFDKVSEKTDEYADLLAERAVQLGGTAQGDLQTVSCQSSLSIYPEDIHAGPDHIRALGSSIGLLAADTREAINTAVDAHDMVTADILTEITRGLDKLHWMIRSHLT